MSMWSSEVSAGPIASPGVGSAGAGTRDCGVPWATRLPRYLRPCPGPASFTPMDITFGARGTLHSQNGCGYKLSFFFQASISIITFYTIFIRGYLVFNRPPVSL